MSLRRKARSAAAADGEQMLPEAEMEILAVLHRGEAEARAIREALAPFRPMSHASVLTLLGRLEAKGLVAHRKGDSGKAFVYFAARAAQPLFRRLLKRVRDRIFAGDSAMLVASLFDGRKPTAEEIDRMRELVDELERRRK